jgi:hypothetical protein
MRDDLHDELAKRYSWYATQDGAKPSTTIQNE